MSEYPTLIIMKILAGLYSSLAKKGLAINIVSNVEELRTFLRRYSGVITNKPIVLSDLSRLGLYQSRILKFIEEQRSPIDRKSVV